MNPYGHQVIHRNPEELRRHHLLRRRRRVRRGEQDLRRPGHLQAHPEQEKEIEKKLEEKVNEASETADDAADTFLGRMKRGLILLERDEPKDETDEKD